MHRFVIITVGKTHSGKTTFAKALKASLNNSTVIDQDNHAEFIHQYYKDLEPNEGPNTLKHTISRAVVDYTVEHTSKHLIICNANRSQPGRLNLLKRFHDRGFKSIVIHFDLADELLRNRISHSEKSTTIFRGETTFEKLLDRQNAESDREDVTPPSDEEADYVWTVHNENDIEMIIQRVVRTIGDGDSNS